MNIAVRSLLYFTLGWIAVGTSPRRADLIIFDNLTGASGLFEHGPNVRGTAPDGMIRRF